MIAYQDNLIGAMKVLSHAEFKVYLCLLFNKDYFPLDFSPEHIQDIANVGKDTIRKALNTLEKCGYLVYDGESKFDFYEDNTKPHKQIKYN